MPTFYKQLVLSLVVDQVAHALLAGTMIVNGLDVVAWRQISTDAGLSNA